MVEYQSKHSSFDRKLKGRERGNNDWVLLSLYDATNLDLKSKGSPEYIVRNIFD